MIDTHLFNVSEFHKAFRIEGPELPSAPTLDLAGQHDMTALAEMLDRAADFAKACSSNPGFRRIALIAEELGELAHALADHNVVGVLDALTDIDYVTNGGYLDFGMGDLKTAAHREVHRSNMTKLDENGLPIYDENGKVSKGPNYKPPVLHALLAAYMTRMGKK